MDSKTMNIRAYSLSDVSMFLGWVCVELPELHNLECPKLLEAWYKYCAQMGIPSALETGAEPSIGPRLSQNRKTTRFNAAVAGWAASRL